jgi:hypothetical protein
MSDVAALLQGNLDILGEDRNAHHRMPCIPPFDNVWIEFNIDLLKAPMRIGAHFKRATPIVWEMTAVVRVASNRKPTYIPATTMVEFAEDGSLVDKHTVMPEGMDEGLEDSIQGLVQVTSAVTITGFMFSHCKNVELVERLPKRHEQREAKRRNEAFLKYREIVIDPGKTKQVAVGSGSSSQDHPVRALHIARGNFATYTADRPLFGKYVGTYWRPAHVRGNADVGTVKSTYRVKAA